MSGERLLGYRVVTRLGAGAGSSVYLVRDTDTGRLFALKHIIRAAAKDIRFVEQMRTEYAISRQFDHPHLRRGLRLKLKRSALWRVREAFLLMEYAPGEPLSRCWSDDVGATCRTFLQVADALEAMHRLGFVHCDLKPDNILRDEQGTVKLIDFGQSCRIGTVKPRIQGTPDFIAPEQASRRAVGPHTDVFGFGGALYWALCHKPIPTLFTAGRGENCFLLHATFLRPDEVNPAVPTRLADLVMQCTETNPARRPADMGAVIHALDAIHVSLAAATSPVLNGAAHGNGNGGGGGAQSATNRAISSARLATSKRR